MSGRSSDLGPDGPAVLYVDDEPQSLKYFARAFGAELRVLTADSAAAAERILADRSQGIGVLVSDQRMPAETGVALLARVKERYPTVIRLLTTAYADLEDAVAAVNRGEIHRYILKPWDMGSLRGELHSALGLYRRRRTELDLLAARRETMAALAAQVAHELATPLATIASAAEGLERWLPVLVEAYRRAGPPPGRGAIPEPVLKALATASGTALESANRSRLLVGLILMNAGAGGAPGAPQEVLWVRALIDEALESYPFAAGERARVAVLGPDFQVAGARPLLVHVLYNLLKNALDAVRARERREIRLACEPGGETGGNWNRLTVADTGCGIPEEAMPHIFDDFFSLKGPGSGTGMGLPFCRRVMRGLGGEIVCRSRLGEYTRMELSFPPAGTDNRDPDALSEDQQ